MMTDFGLVQTSPKIPVFFGPPYFYHLCNNVKMWDNNGPLLQQCHKLKDAGFVF